ncbi:MAG: phospholipid carrier-dependent glycosyltransferase [Pseudomonadota bacterium]|nr:phospholipid carrier-dependent glycosyltransferase [Pseudomonadota bacterium]
MPIPPADTRRDWWFGIGVTSFALALFCYNIAGPAALYFDETHYVPAARALLARSGPVNIEHPLFAKTLIAAGIALFGDNAWGWRLPIAVCATGGVAALFWMSRQLFADRRAALCATLLVIFNQSYFIQARIAMLDMPMTAFLLLAAGCLLRGTRTDAAAVRWRYAGAVSLGLAIGAKWLAIPYAMLFLALGGWRGWRSSGSDVVFLIDIIVPDILKLGLTTLPVYLASFWPAFLYQHDAMSLPRLFGFQMQMLAAQRAPLPGHPYQSDWWQWPLMLRPIWYLFAKTGHAYEAVLMVGNPVIYWGGMVLVLVLLGGWLKLRTPPVLLTVGTYLFSLLIWIVIPKPIGFFYYYNLSAIALCLVIAAFFDALGERGRRWLVWVTGASGAMFFYFYPIIAAQPLPTDNTWTGWVWMKSWY